MAHVVGAFEAGAQGGRPAIGQRHALLEQRMGKGKAETAFWAARIKPGTVLFEIAGVPEDIARQAMARIAHKMPVRCRFVGRRLTV